MFSFLINALKIIFVLGFLVLIHEAGHFIVARLCKVRVNEFSIGFGPNIWKKQGKQTKYSLRLIPLGGYVSLEGEDERSEQEGSYSKASIPKRMAIIVAGGVVNIIFGLLVYFILMTATGNNSSLIVNELIPEYAAEQYGILPGDEIIEVNDKKIRIKSDLDKILEESNGEELEITINRNGNLQDITLIPTKQEYKTTGIYLKGTSEGDTTKILTVEANSVSEKQGIKANDEIIKINGIDVYNQQQIVDLMTEAQTESIIITIERNGEVLDIELIPNIGYTYYLGVYFKLAENNLGNNMYYSVFKTRDFALSIVENLKMIFTGNVRADQMMGPVGISEVVAKTSSVEDFVYILALISLSLGVTNLLPFPALDGGKFVLLLIEAIRRKKLSEKTEINLQLIGFAILIMLSLYITYNDILRII